MDLAGPSGKFNLNSNQNVQNKAVNYGIILFSAQLELLRQLTTRPLESKYLCQNNSLSTVPKLSIILVVMVGCRRKPLNISNTTVALILRRHIPILVKMVYANSHQKMLVYKLWILSTLPW